ncbi:Major facilitator superfamily domain general substrate transporter [Penicillium verhagenii]|nr:Major facilitator superfamily domain general substrate transporter [Penicillium verhagenii]
MSTQIETETIVLQARNSDTQSQEPGPDVLQESEPNQQQQTKWLYPKIFSAGVSFFVAGVNDGSLGSLIPYIIRSYDIGTNMVAVLYGVTFFGWFFAALSNSFIVRYLDLGALLSLGAALQILAHVLRTWLPPFPLYAVTFLLASLGQALNDTHANTFVSSQRGAHRWLGFIHAMYMAGCLSALAGKNALREIKTTLSTPGVWLLSLFFFFFLGASITAGGWMVEYLVKVRHGDVKDMGYVPAGFYGGGFLGRLFLAEPTHRLGERRMIFIYAVLCVGLQLVFWLVPNIITEAVAVSLLGLFSGPFFPTGISVGSKIFDPEIVSSGIAFVFVLGQIGGSIFPAITGVIAAQVGVKVLQPMLVGLLCAAGVSWLFLPKDAALHRD